MMKVWDLRSEMVVDTVNYSGSERAKKTRAMTVKLSSNYKFIFVYRYLTLHLHFCTHVMDNQVR